MYQWFECTFLASLIAVSYFGQVQDYLTAIISQEANQLVKAVIGGHDVARCTSLTSQRLRLPSFFPSFRNRFSGTPDPSMPLLLQHAVEDFIHRNCKDTAADNNSPVVSAEALWQPLAVYNTHQCQAARTHQVAVRAGSTQLAICKRLSLLDTQLSRQARGRQNVAQYKPRPL